MSDDPRIRRVLSDHFIMWRSLTDGGGPPGEWFCSCDAKFGFSDTAIDHVASALAAVDVVVDEHPELPARIEALAVRLESEADGICPAGHYDKKDKAWRVAHVRRRVAGDLRAALQGRS